MEKKLSLFGFCLITLLLSGASGILAADPSDDEDFGYWSTTDIEKKVGERWKFKIGEDLRFREHTGIYYLETHVGVNYKACKYFALGAEYLQNRATRTVGRKDVWFWESNPRIYATPQISWKGFLLEDRNMLELRFKEDIEDTVRYRNQVTLTAPWKWTRFEFQPYTANEIFIESTRNGVIEDRFYSGFKMHWWGPIYGSIFYLRDATKNSLGKWKELNVLGTSLKYSF